MSGFALAVVLIVSVWVLGGAAVIVRRAVREAEHTPAAAAAGGVGRVMGGLAVAVAAELLVIVLAFAVVGLGVIPRAWRDLAARADGR